MMIDTSTLAHRPVEARTNTLRVPMPLRALASTLASFLTKNHPLLKWHWQPAPNHARKTPWEERLETEREELYTALFGDYDADNAKFLNWRRVEHAGQDWLLCSAMLKTNSTTCNPPPKNLSDAACCAWVELQCLWLVVLSKPSISAWTDAFGPGASWYVGLRPNDGWASAFKVQTHVVAHSGKETVLSVTLKERAFRESAANAEPSSKVGSGLLAWSNLYLGHKVPLHFRRPIFDAKTKAFWDTKWSYYNSVSDALQTALLKVGLAPTPDTFTASHCWVGQKITPSDLPIAATISVANLSKAPSPTGNAVIEAAIRKAIPTQAPVLQWTSGVPTSHASTMPTLVVQPAALIEGEHRCCWFIDAKGNRQWVPSKEALLIPKSQGLTVDPYSGYKLSIGTGPIPTTPIQGIAATRTNKSVWGKTLRELLMQPWWLSSAPMAFPDCTLPQETFAVWHQTIDNKGIIGLVVLHLEWSGKELVLNRVVRQRLVSKATFQQQYPGKPVRNGWWMEDAQNNRLEISTETPHGFILRGNVHANTASLRASIAPTRGPRKAKEGKIQKLVSDEVLSRGVEAQLLPYYTSPWLDKVPYSHKSTVYLQEKDTELRAFVPPYVPLNKLDGFRQFRIVRFWDHAKGAYVPWTLSSGGPSLLHWYLRTLTHDLLQLKENSQMCMLEKMAQECQIDA